MESEVSHCSRSVLERAIYHSGTRVWNPKIHTGEPHPQKIDSHQLNIVAELGSTAAVIQGIKSRVGISILSPIAVAEDLKAGTVSALEISGVNLKRSFYLTRHKERSPSPLCKTFMAFINELDLPAP